MSDQAAQRPETPALDAGRVRAVLDGARGLRVVVLGDMVLDEHVVGRAQAVAREAPVLIIEPESRYAVPGCATNVAANLRALDCAVSVCGVVGRDNAAQTLREQLAERGIGTAGLVADSSRATSIKQRIWAGGDRQRPQQMVARVDTVDRRDLDGPVAAELITYLERTIPKADALLISDYQNGVVGSDVLAAALPLARKHGLIIAVDAHGRLARFRGAAVVTPNQPEAEAELGHALASPELARSGAAELREHLEAQGVVITLGAAGMAVAAENAVPVIIPAAPQAHFADPTGAGDTVAAAVTAGLLGGGSILEAALLGDLAARIVIRQLGAAVASAEDILAEADAAND